MSARRLALAGLASLAVVACDESQVRHEPSWSLARMQEQPRVDPYDRGMRAPPPFTVARGQVAAQAPPPITRARVERGREAFEIVCAACHGIRGDGQSVVATKMLLRPPPSLLEPRVRALTDDALEAIVARGYGLMPAHAGELSPEDRWATIAYVRALQLAQGVKVDELPASLRAELAEEAP